MKKFLLLFIVLFILLGSQAQNVGIGTTTPDPSAQLDVSSTTQGLLVPRMTKTQRDAISSPANGLLIYQTTNSPGFYFYNGSTWKIISSGGPGWLLKGNSNTNPLNDFIGTTDNQPLNFRLNDSRAGYLGLDGNVFWGLQNGLSNAGYSNVAIGNQALYSNVDASNLVAIGDSALYNNLSGTFNTAVGTKALFTNGTGINNTAIGAEAMYNNTYGHFNTGVGVQALYNNTTGLKNTAVGNFSLKSNTTGYTNTAIGMGSLINNTTGSSNAAVGYLALQNNITGYSNVAMGCGALSHSINDINQVAIGDSALFTTDGSYYNTAVGSKAIYSNTFGSSLTAVGFQALYSNTEANENSALGYLALYSNTTGTSNTSVGSQSLKYNTTGSSNAATGYAALFNNTTGSSNSSYGRLSLYTNTTGIGNTGIGALSLYSNVSGNNNTSIGYFADVSSGNLTNATAIGYNAKVNASNKVRIGDGNVTVIEGQVAWSFPSDARFKYNIKDNVPGLDFITKLKPVTYYFDTKKLDTYTKTGVMDNSIIQPVDYTGEEELHTGFLAQDVEKVADELGYHFDGIHKPANDRDHYSLAYSQFIMPLVKAVQEQQVMIIKQKQLITQQQTENKQFIQRINSLESKLSQLEQVISTMQATLDSLKANRK